MEGLKCGFCGEFLYPSDTIEHFAEAHHIHLLEPIEEQSLMTRWVNFARRIQFRANLPLAEYRRKKSAI